LSIDDVDLVTWDASMDSQLQIHTAASLIAAKRFGARAALYRRGHGGCSPHPCWEGLPRRGNQNFSSLNTQFYFTKRYCSNENEK